MNLILSPLKNIFLADDDIEDCELFEDALRELSFETKLNTAKDGIELMKILDKSINPMPDLIFLDLNMPRKDGFECLHEIKLSPMLRNIPIVIFSTSSDKITVDKAYQLGANFYVPKPRSFQLLKNAIGQILTFDWKTNLDKQPLRAHFLICF